MDSLSERQQRMVEQSFGYQTKDSGKRAEYESGMVRDTEEGKARFGLLFPKGVPYANQMLTRFAELMARGAKKYTERNWEKAEGEVELERYLSSALRHLIQWATGETDEDHAAAVMFNILAGETVRFKLEKLEKPLDRIKSASHRPPCPFMAPKCRGGNPEVPCAYLVGHAGPHQCFAFNAFNYFTGGRCAHEFVSPDAC